MRNQTRELQASLQRLTVAIAQATVTFRVAHVKTDAVRKQFTKVEQALQRFKTVLPEWLEVLAEHGWFIAAYTAYPRQLPRLVSVAQFFQANRIEEGHQVLCCFFDNALPAIEKDLFESFPNRAQIIRKAVAAHRAGDYELSIPVLLSQADGIARETIAPEVKKFSITSRQDKCKIEIERFIKDNVKRSLFADEILRVALADLPLNVSEGNVKLKGDVVNRNAILHGMNTSYATRVNSCRAVSWLEYILSFNKILAETKSAPTNLAVLSK